MSSLNVNNRASVDRIDQNHIRSTFPYLTLFVIFTSELFLFPTVLCYGIYLEVFSSANYWSIRDGLWPIVAFLSSWMIANTWSRSFCESWLKGGGKVTKISLTVTVLLLFLVQSLGSVAKNLPAQIVLYGMCGGWLSSTISTQIRYHTGDLLISDWPQPYKISVQFSRAFAPFVFPHLLEFLARFYGPAEAQFVLSPLVLHIIPLTFLIRSSDLIRTNRELHKFKTITSLSRNNCETPNVSRASSVYSIDTSAIINSSSDDEDEEPIIDEEVPNNIVTSQELVDNYLVVDEDNIQNYRNLVTLNYLPKIPEEEEFDDDDDDINEVTSKRLSRISAKLEQIRNNNVQRKSFSSVNNLFRPEDENYELEETNKIEENSESIPPGTIEIDPISTKNRFFDQFRNVKRALYEEWLRNLSYNLKSAFKDALFVPALLSKVTTNLFNILCLALVPYLSLYSSSSGDGIDDPSATAITLTTISFTWCIFLKAHTFLKKFSLLKLRLVFIFGLMVQSLSFYCLCNLKGQTWGLLLFGLGLGVITYSEERAYQHLFGCTNKKVSIRWKRRRPILQIFAALVVIPTYLVIYLLRIEVVNILQVGFYLYVTCTGLWLCISFIKCICCTRVGSARLHIEV